MKVKITNKQPLLVIRNPFLMPAKRKALSVAVPIQMLWKQQIGNYREIHMERALGFKRAIELERGGMSYLIR